MLRELKIVNDVTLADLTTFKIGGAARFFAYAKSSDDVVTALKLADKRGIDLFILGGGSNVLIADEGFDGLVLQIGLKGISLNQEDRDTVYVTAEAGEDWDEFVEFCIGKNLAGLECLSGIPGLVGGTPIQNVGAYGQEVSESIISVRVFDRREKVEKTLLNPDCEFEYRKSIFNTIARDRYVVLSVTYSLKLKGEPKLVYRDLKQHFVGRVPTLIETRKAVCEIRHSKGMLVRQGGFDSQSAGSFFKNPIVSNTDFESIERIATGKAFGVPPKFVVDETSVKVPAAWLIEKAGFAKGFRQGNAGTSTKHSLALTNRGSASAQEILDLKETIQRKVKTIFGIDLAPEPNLIGFGK